MNIPEYQASKWIPIVIIVECYFRLVTTKLSNRKEKKYRKELRKKSRQKCRPTDITATAATTKTTTIQTEYVNKLEDLSTIIKNVYKYSVVCSTYGYEAHSCESIYRARTHRLNNIIVAIRNKLILKPLFIHIQLDSTRLGCCLRDREINDFFFRSDVNGPTRMILIRIGSESIQSRRLNDRNDGNNKQLKPSSPNF